MDEELKQKIINALTPTDEDAYEVVNSIDNSEVRDSNMVAVGIDETTQVNVGLPDYKHVMSIFVSTHISEDLDGEVFKNTCEEVKRKLNKYVLKEENLDTLFEEVPVVGFFFDSENVMVVDDEYGKCYLDHMKYTIITSW